MRSAGLCVFICCAALFAADTFSQRQREFWSFQKVKPQTPPAVKTAAWARTAIDRFVAAKLEAKGIAPGPAADKVTLLRRATFDLIGLPPTPAEVEAFVADRSPDAFAKVVERLLASPQYGERWGRHCSVRISASVVSPSAPQFHELLSLDPSWLFSPFASLCFPL